jgi:hypothetical protein
MSSTSSRHRIDLVAVCQDILATKEVLCIAIVWLPPGAIKPITRTVVSKQDPEREIDLLRGIIEFCP